MGGKAKAPKAPDYGPLIAAQKEAAEYSYQLAQRQQDWAEKTYADNKDVNDVVINKALGALDMQEDWARSDRDRYESIFQPLEEQLAYEAESYASPERMEFEAGKAEADVAAQFEQARGTASQRLEDFGVDPSQTRQGALDLGTRIAEAAAQSSAGGMSRTQTENIGRALRSEAINVGKGYPGQAGASIAGSGASGTGAVNTGLAGTASGASTMGTGQGWAGMANQGWGNIGNFMSQDYQNKMSGYQAQQESSSGWGGALGMVGGLASKFIGLAEGGAVPEPDHDGLPVPYEASPSNGAIPDDIAAQTDSGAPAQINAGEFIVPRRVVSWIGEKQLQKLIMKADQEMQGENGERPAQPEVADKPPAPQLPVESVGAIPTPQGVV